MTITRALITGATGFVGSVVAHRLLGAGWNVHVVARPRSALDRLRTQAAEMTVHHTDGSVESMRSIIARAKPDAVLHLASLFVPEHQPEHVAPLVQSNVLFGVVLLEAMRLEGSARLVNTGTSWQHFEGRPYGPTNLYAATKQAFEAIIDYYVDACALSAITLELFDTYGPADTRRKFLSLLLDAVKTQTPLAASPGDQQIDLVHVDDVANAYETAARLVADAASRGTHRRFAVSSGAPLTLRSLAEEVGRAAGSTVPVIWGGRPYRAREVMQSRSTNAVLPGWAPRISLQEGIRSLLRD